MSDARQSLIEELEKLQEELWEQAGHIGSAVEILRELSETENVLTRAKYAKQRAKEFMDK